MKRSAPPKRYKRLQAVTGLNSASGPKRNTGTKRSKVSGSIRPTADQQRWHDWLRNQGCAICGATPEIHHCVGSAGKHEGVWIGQDFVIPLCNHHHTGLAGIHSNISQCCADGGIPAMTRKELEKRLFHEHIAHYKQNGHGGFPVRQEAIVAIARYHR
jgi:hypothetical protein